jgi:hypothetical protein
LGLGCGAGPDCLSADSVCPSSKVTTGPTANSNSGDQLDYAPVRPRRAPDLTSCRPGIGRCATIRARCLTPHFPCKLLSALSQTCAKLYATQKLNIGVGGDYRRESRRDQLRQSPFQLSSARALVYEVCLPKTHRRPHVQLGTPPTTVTPSKNSVNAFWSWVLTSISRAGRGIPR